jgi:hypothetical protein
MPLDRTLTVKKRRIDVYLPTLESKARWNEAAAKHSMSLSQYVAQVMEERLNPVPEAAPADVSGTRLRGILGANILPLQIKDGRWSI